MTSMGPAVNNDDDFCLVNMVPAAPVAPAPKPKTSKAILMEILTHVGIMHFIKPGAIFNFSYSLFNWINKKNPGHPLPLWISVPAQVLFGYLNMKAIERFIDPLLQDQGRLVYALAPAKVLLVNYDYTATLISMLYHQLPSGKNLAAAGDDFFNLMHGHADEALVNRYRQR